MAITVELIDIGALANDGTGDPLRVAFDKINNNFSTLSALSFPSPGGPDGAIQYRIGPTFNGDPTLVLDTANSKISVGSNIAIQDNSIVDIGSRPNPVHKLYLSNAGMDIGNVSLTEAGNTISFSIVGSPNARISLAGLNDINVSGNIITSGNVALGNSLAYGNTIIGSLTVVTTTNAVNQVVYETPANKFTMGVFKISSSRRVSVNYTQNVTIDVAVNGDKSDISYVAHSTVFTGVLPVTKYNVDLHFGNVRVMVSPQFADTVYHIISYEIDD